MKISMNTVTGLFGIILFLAFIGGLAESIGAVPFIIIVAIISAMAIYDFVGSVRDERKKSARKTAVQEREDAQSWTIRPEHAVYRATNMPEWLKSYLRAPFVVIVWFMETYGKNSTRLRAFMAKPDITKIFKIAIGFTMVVWIVVGVIASDDDRSRLTETLKGFWGEMQDLNEQKKLQNN